MDNKIKLLILVVALIFIGFALYSKIKFDEQQKNTAVPIIVGFAQLGSESAWRNANSNSVKESAKRYGVNLIFKNAEGDQKLQKQIIQDFIIQQVDVIVFPPLVSNGWDDVLKNAKEAGIPVILSDRMINTKDPSLYKVAIGSDFLEEGKKAGKWLINNSNGKEMNILEIRGLDGSTPADYRAKGFRQAIKGHPNIRIIDSETGNFIKAQGSLVMGNMLKKYGKKINVVFAHNDDMALGAITAIEAYGLKPGKDILIISVDGEKAALQAIKDGKVNVSIECTPLIGPIIMDAVKDLIAGKKLPKKIISKEKVFTVNNVNEELPLSQY